jgi:TorA maturation chaperone TorD
MEQPLAQLRGDLRTLGIERQSGVCEPEDHVAALCDTMALLINGDASVSIERQHVFYARHIETWVPRFFRDLQRAASARFYRAVGQLGEQFIDVESQAFRVGTPAAGVTMPS